MAKSKNRVRTRGGVSKEAKSKSVVPFEVSEQNKFNVAQIIKFEASVRKTENDGVVPVLVIHWADTKKEREHFHTEWAIREDVEWNGKTYDVNEQVSWQDDMLAHLYNTFAGDGAHSEAGLGEINEEKIASVELPEGLEGEAMIDWFYFFWSVADQFNNNRDGKPIYQNKDGKPILHWVKLTYNKKDNLQIPKWGNIIDLYVKGKPTLLQMGKKDSYTKKPKVNIPSAAANNFQPPATDDNLPEGF